jgi:hypothetical protein
MTTGLTPRLDSIIAGTQGSVDESSLISVPYTTVVNRAQIPDLTNDLRASFGVDRIPVQQLYRIHNEVGPNGEHVWGVLNDDRGLIRFVGSTWVCTGVPSIGQPIYSAAVGEYIEIVFYGTGLNLIYFSDVTARSFYVTVDGGTESVSNIYVQSTATLTNRNYNTNHVAVAASGLTLGLHTVKIRSGNATATYVYGFEIINTNTSGLLNINSGTAYSKSTKYTNSVIDSIAYNKDQAGSTVVTGTKGGRIVRAITGNDTISTYWQAVDASSLRGASATHANEELARKYYVREFGSGRNSTAGTLDDFSIQSGLTFTNLAFTLDDGTTTLVLNQGYMDDGGTAAFLNGLTPRTDSTVGFTLTFVGCGLDVELVDAASGGNDTYQYSIDGEAMQTWFNTAGSTARRVQKVVSGLAYGTHTFQFKRLSPVTWTPKFFAFLVYQPKKPALPSSGAIELCDYNVLADYSASAVTGTAVADWPQIPLGVLAKVAAREFIYVGVNWAINTIDPTTPFGFNTNTLTNNNQTATYTFFGTGAMVLCGASAAGTYYFSVTIDSTLNSSGANMVNATLIGSGVYNCTSSTSGQPCRVAFTGLSLGFHTITVQRVTGGGAGNFVFNGLHIITPLHVHKSNVYGVLQNTLSIGSTGMLDTRQTAPSSSRKAWAQAVGITSGGGPTISSVTAGYPIPDMSTTIKTTGGALEIAYSVSVAHSSAGTNIAVFICIDGSYLDTSPNVRGGASGAGYTFVLAHNVVVPVSAGFHKVDLFWSCGGATASAITDRRILKVREL